MVPVEPQASALLRQFQHRVAMERVTLWIIRSRARRNLPIMALAGVVTLGAILVASDALTVSQWEALGTWVAGLGTLFVSWLVLDLNRRMHRIESERAERERIEEWRQTHPLLTITNISAMTPVVFFTVKNIGGESSGEISVTNEYRPPGGPDSAFVLHPEFVRRATGETFNVAAMSQDELDDEGLIGNLMLGPGDSADYYNEQFFLEVDVDVLGVPTWWRYAGITVTTLDDAAEAHLYAKSSQHWVTAPCGVYPSTNGVVGVRPKDPPPWRLAQWSG